MAGIPQGSVPGQSPGMRIGYQPPPQVPGAAAPAVPGPSPMQPSFVDPTAQIQQILQAFAPEAYNAQKNLNEQMSQYGIEGGPALALTQGLQGQLTSSLAPELGQTIGQANIFNADQANQVRDMLMQMMFGGYQGALQGGLSGVSGVAPGIGGNFGINQSPDWTGLGLALGNSLGGGSFGSQLPSGPGL